MAWVYFTLEGKSEAEVLQKVENKLKEAEFLGLHQERDPVIKNEGPKTGWRAYLSLHS
jgi:hypothetical protein